MADASGGVLPGVSVTLNNAQGSVGGRQVTQTDERGTYQFVRLVPGHLYRQGRTAGLSPSRTARDVVNADQRPAPT